MPSQMKKIERITTALTGSEWKEEVVKLAGIVQDFAL
jgi:hypothetical protein